MDETGIFIAYAAIGTMAVVPIYYGSFSSLDRLKSAHKKKREEFAEYSDSEDEDEDSEAVSAEDAYMFPVYGSAALFTMYMVFKYLNADWVNLLLSSYFALLGVAAVTQVGVRLVKSISGIKLPLYHMHLVHRHKTMAHVRFSNLHLAMVGVSALITGFYMYTKNWLVSNLFGLAFSFSAITLIRLDSFKSGMIMLAGLFVYDVFWVFGTEVMVSVAKNFDAPIKVVFPKQLFPSDGVLKFTMLGLGDIVVPGIFLALALRFDRHQYLAKLGYSKDKALPKELKGKHRGFGFPVPYFTACLAAYVAGLATTISVMHVFKAAQPALLYLSPACILAVLGTAVVRGELTQVFAYAEESKEEEEEKKEKPTVTHRYNLRNHSAAGQATPASGGELADDEQEVANSDKVLEETVNPLDKEAESPKKAKPKRTTRKTKSKK
ncbi:hypothetical protein EV183_000016 [Coemansia sp. RSA 2336]|nr:hypothetical protein EV183_000638 [Coemansia sp. RSA 2336]KAJ2456460.1 hypothetical protein EV183_000016 [Coemansia sp. RSA 2336]